MVNTYFTAEKLVGHRIVLVIEATIRPFISVSARPGDILGVRLGGSLYPPTGGSGAGNSRVSVSPGAMPKSRRMR
jgi:hypothetical protein